MQNYRAARDVLRKAMALMEEEGDTLLVALISQPLFAIETCVQTAQDRDTIADDRDTAI